MATAESVKVPYPGVAVIFGMLFSVMVPLYLMFQESPKGAISRYLLSPSLNYVHVIVFSIVIFVLLNYALKHSNVDRLGQRLTLAAMLSGILIWCFTTSDVIIANRAAFNSAASVEKEYRVYGVYLAGHKGVTFYNASLGFNDEYGKLVYVPLNKEAYGYLYYATTSPDKPPLCIRLSEQVAGKYRRLLVERRQYSIGSFRNCESA